MKWVFSSAHTVPCSNRDSSATTQICAVAANEPDLVEWEGHAKHAAIHEPYLLLFDFHYIEIRDLKTLTLVQIMRAKNIKCTFDGTTVIRSDPALDTGQNARIHFSNEGDAPHTNNSYIISELCPSSSLLLDY